MQVWPLRTTHAIAAGADTPQRKLPGKAATDSWALRILSGTHVGAERRLDRRGMLLVGSGDDCDIILADVGVGAHHCIITYAEGALSVRAVDADVRVDGRTQHPGDPQSLAPFSTVQIGSASFAVGPHWSERWQNVLQKIDPAEIVAVPQTRRASRGRIAALWTAALLLIASGGALVLAQHNTDVKPQAKPVVSADKQIRALIASIGPASRLDLKTQPDGSYVINGYVERGDELDALKTQLQRRGLKATIEAKSGPRIAGDVGEFFRMNDIHATTQWNGKGHVLVRGHFGDEEALRGVLTSRTMQDFNENLHLKVDVQNLDPPSTDTKPVADGKRIRRVVDGADAYLVTVDGSRYYRGAKLPQGGVFVGIENDDVLVSDGADNVRHVPRDSVVDAPSRN